MAAGGYAERPAGTLGTLRLQTTRLPSAFNKSGAPDPAGEAAEIAMEHQLPVVNLSRLTTSSWPRSISGGRLVRGCCPLLPGRGIWDGAGLAEVTRRAGDQGCCGVEVRGFEPLASSVRASWG
jgi:hypothetical protein